MWDEAAVAEYRPRCQNNHMRECDEIDWQSWELVRDDQNTRLEEQLGKEITAAHPLYEAVERLKIIARDTSSDDILVADPTQILDSYVVHLVWSDGKIEEANFPSTCSISKSLLPRKYQ